jgi:hypothetical protein
MFKSRRLEAYIVYLVAARIVGSLKTLNEPISLIALALSGTRHNTFKPKPRSHLKRNTSLI